MKYEVLEYFEDLLDNRRKYFPGDAYPRRGLKPTAERLEEYFSALNKDPDLVLKTDLTMMDMVERA